MLSTPKDTPKRLPSSRLCCYCIRSILETEEYKNESTRGSRYVYGLWTLLDTCPEVFEMEDDVAKVLVDEVPANFRISAAKRPRVVRWKR